MITVALSAPVPGVAPPLKKKKKKEKRKREKKEKKTNKPINPTNPTNPSKPEPEFTNQQNRPRTTYEPSLSRPTRTAPVCAAPKPSSPPS